MKSAKDDGLDIKTIISTNVRINYYAIGVVGSYIYYAYENNQLLMVNKIAESTPTLLYNETSKIYSVFVFDTSERFYVSSFRANHFVWVVFIVGDHTVLDTTLFELI
ncbi:Hypothetical predicted protein [Mytilus galloprovincialis]|uniref:Uncharacterized protein n=1 Tax=Mytilus galloprovincialis TaxID=29158 RepID=A0A8B6HQ17_MYTGA|nr:Hypothetical predicted protein [Mytilus galloprovincialis]